uniref:Uncharacterized protein n=1 Tax=Arundo donax TaxID=35708 RepID=A0A0A9BV78_ARUDO
MHRRLSCSPQAEDAGQRLETKLVAAKQKRLDELQQSTNYTAVPYNYAGTSSSSTYVPLGKAPYFDGTHYASWKHKMKIYLRAIHPSIWRIVESGYTVEDEDNLTPDEEQNEHKNAQAACAIFNALSENEFNWVYGLERAKDIWDTLRNVHEGTSSVREYKIELLRSKLDWFIMEEGETPTEMYNRLSLIVNEIKGLGCKEMTDHFVVKRMLRALTPRNANLVTIIRWSEDYKKLTPHDVLGKILVHEMMEEESKKIHDLINKGSSSKKKDSTLKARKEA